MGEMDSFRSFKNAEARIEADVKSGKLPREKAKAILDSARENYRSQSYNKQLERLKNEKD